MRPALIVTAAALSAVLPACGGNAGENSGPERPTAAGEVLGGEISDAMIPLDTVQSTSPPAPGPTATGSGSAGPRTPAKQDEVLPEPEMSNGPEPLPADPSAEDLPSRPPQ